jgi:hypothetical protein
MLDALLVLSVGCSAPSASSLPVLPISPSATVSVDTAHVEAIETPASRHYEISNAVAAPGGGIFAAGPLDNPKAWAFMLTGAEALGWKQESQPYEQPFVVGTGAGGGYWVAGVAHTRDVGKEIIGNAHALDVLKEVQFEYLRRFGADGSMSDRVPISSIGENHFLKCGIAVPGGYVFTGWAFRPMAVITSPGMQPVRLPDGDHTALGTISPWIEMIDESGHRLWERTFSEHDNRVLRDPLGVRAHCAGLYIGADKKITWAVEVLTNQIVNTPKGRAVVQPLSYNGFWGTFLVQLDADGHDLVQTFRPEMQFPHLARTSNGFVLFENFVGEDQDPPPTQRFARRINARLDYGLHITTFDGSLRQLKQNGFAPDEWLSTVQAIYQTPEGGYILASCEGFDGPSFLRYFTPNGQFSQRASVPSHNHCDQFAVGAGKAPGTVIVLGSNLSETTVVVARYSN